MAKYKRINLLRTGLDIDDVLADFWSAYCERFDTANNPKMLESERITRNVQRILKHDKEFWLSLKPIVELDFVPELYCTKRVCNKRWTRQWLIENGFPDRPIYQMVNQHGNKADMIKGRVDVFVDDSVSNVIKMNKSGIPTLLKHTCTNEHIVTGKIFEISRDTIIDGYVYLKKYELYGV